MAKYYVISGRCRIVIAGQHIENSQNAACEAICIYLKTHKPKNLSYITIVSEKGFHLFEHEIDRVEDDVFETKQILKKAGLI